MKNKFKFFGIIGGIVILIMTIIAYLDLVRHD
jgi:hypothetical protein